MRTKKPWKTETAAPKVQQGNQLQNLLDKSVRERISIVGHRFVFTVCTGGPLDINVERSRRLAPVLAALELEKAGYHAFRHFNVSMVDSWQVPLKTIQERIGHALTGSFALDVYGHTLDWQVNEEAARALGAETEKAVTNAEDNLDSGPLTPYKQNDPQTLNLEVI